MTTTIITKNSSTAGGVPLAADLTAGELAINLTDKRLFSKLGSTVFEVGTNPSAIALANGTGLPIIAGTTGTLSTARGGTNLTSFTANGVVYASSTSALATGSALTFDGTYFTVGASATTGDYKAFIQKAGGELLGLNASSGTLTRIAFGNANASFGSTQIIANAADLAFITNSAEQMRLTSTGLGIGTSSPQAKLQIAGASNATVLKVSSTDQASGMLSLGDGSSTTNNVGVYRGQPSALSNGNWLNLGGYDGIAFTTGNNALGSQTERMRLDSSGNLGLGVTPSASWTDFTVFQNKFGAILGYDAGQSHYTLNAYYQSGTWKYLGSNSATKYSQVSGNHAWYTAPSGTAGDPITFTQAMTLDASGNLLVGATSSIGRTTVVGGGTSQLAFHDGNGGSNSYGYLNYGGNSGELTLNALSTGGNTLIRFLTSNGGTNAERARIDSSGNFLIGTTTNGKITLFGSGFSEAGAAGIDIQHISGSVTGDYYQSFQYGGSVIGSITQSGTTAVLYNTTSDYRLKDVIGAVSGSGERIDALEPVEYSWKSDGSRTRGFLAHKFQEVYAGSVNGTKDAVNADGKPVYQSMQAGSSEVIADLVAEIQSLRKRLATLEAK